jgi:hypothetical protein
MTEAEWLAYGPSEMTRFMRDNGSQRKLRLLTVASCRRIWHLLSDHRSRAAVEVAERFADGAAAREELEQAWALAEEAENSLPNEALQLAATAASHSVFPNVLSANLNLNVRAMGMAAWVSYTYEAGIAFNAEWAAEAFEAAELKEQQEWLALCRHLVGNPFRPHVGPGHWSSTVISIAQSLYAGSNCHFALHDALLETGHTELAEHFREPSHPKGCWALDLILGKA